MKVLGIKYRTPKANWFSGVFGTVPPPGMEKMGFEPTTS